MTPVQITEQEFKMETALRSLSRQLANRSEELAQMEADRDFAVQMRKQADKTLEEECYKSEYFAAKLEKLGESLEVPPRSTTRTETIPIPIEGTNE